VSFVVCLLADGYYVCVVYSLSDYGVGAHVMVFFCTSGCIARVPVVSSCVYFDLINTSNVVCSSATSDYSYSIAATSLVCCGACGGTSIYSIHLVLLRWFSIL
jgi:hypothetical protein